MVDDKKNISEAAPPVKAPTPTVENAAVLEQPASRVCADRRRGSQAEAAYERRQGCS